MRSRVLNRRRAIALLGGAGATAMLGSKAAYAASCLATPAQTEGTYFVEENLNRSDIRVDPTNGAVSQGIPLTLKFKVSQVTNTACGALAGARVKFGIAMQAAFIRMRRPTGAAAGSFCAGIRSPMKMAW